MIWVYILFAFLAGVLIPAQSGINSQLARWLGHPVLAALVSFVVGAFVLSVYALFLRSSWPTLASLAGAPWWVWTGGFFGAFFITVAAAYAPKLGAATFISVALAGQMLASLALDHFGLVGFEVRHVTPWRFVGALLVIIGVVLVRRF
ncbi:MAG TPA: DMT family transporter [Pyrinomonadaceae bacterium]|jgi:transporter family-2 protein